MPSQYGDLQHIVGRVVVPPISKETSKGDIAEFKVSVQRNYGQGEGNYGDSRLMTVAVWNADLAAKVLDEVYKGATVAVEGTIKKQDDKYGDMSAMRVGLVAFIAKAGSKAKRPANDPDEF